MHQSQGRRELRRRSDSLVDSTNTGAARLDFWCAGQNFIVTYEVIDCTPWPHLWKKTYGAFDPRRVTCPTNAASSDFTSGGRIQPLGVSRVLPTGPSLTRTLHSSIGCADVYDLRRSVVGLKMFQRNLPLDRIRVRCSSPCARYATLRLRLEYLTDAACRKIELPKNPTARTTRQSSLISMFEGVEVKRNDTTATSSNV
jgi:hypothetical protein